MQSNIGSHYELITLLVLLVLLPVLILLLYYKAGPALRKRSEKRQKEIEEQEKAEKKFIAMDIIKRTYPLKSLTKEEIAKLPLFEMDGLEKDFLEKHPVGFEFLFRYTLLPKTLCFGKIGESKDAFGIRVGGNALGLPAKFINRYIVQEI
jgi:hypothetical protein